MVTRTQMAIFSPLLLPVGVLNKSPLHLFGRLEFGVDIKMFAQIHQRVNET